MKRLKDGERNYAKELAIIDSAAAAKGGDITQLKLMLKDAEHVRDVAAKELLKVQETSEREQRQQKMALQERRKKLESRREAVAAFEQRCVARLDALEIEKDAAQTRLDELAVVDPADVQSEHEQIMQYEEQFLQIKQVVGVIKVDEIIERFSQQEEAAATLDALIVETQTRIDQVKAARTEIKRAVEALRYSGDVQAEKSSEEFSLERRMSETERLSALRGERQRRTRLRRAKALLTEARVAIEHLGEVCTKSAALPDADEAGGTGGTPKLALAGVDLDKLQEILSAQRAPAPDLSAETLAASLRAHIKQLREMHDRIHSSDYKPPASPECALVTPRGDEEQGNDNAVAVEAEQYSSPEVSPLVGARERRRALAAAESAAAVLAPSQGPLFKVGEENWRIDHGDDETMEEDYDDEDPDDPTDPVVDRATLKSRAEREVKKHTKGHRRKAALGDGHSEDAADS